MIINGGSRSNGAFFARHLMRADQNERVTMTDIRGFGYAQDVPSAFLELQDLAEGTRCKNYFYHANINTRADERLSPEQWAQAVDRLESELHLEGQPRFVVEHDKDGRVHRHVVWGRIDADDMTTIPDGLNYRSHERVATELEESFGHSVTERALTRDEGTPRPKSRPADWETFRAQESKIDPQAMKAELTELWQRADTGPAFAAALEERGYILARGDRRDFCVIDQAGDEHSLARRLSGVKAAEIRARMADVDRDTLPTVADARDLARSRPEEADGEPIGAAILPVEPPVDTTTEAQEMPGSAPPIPLLEADAKEPFQPSLRDELPTFESVMAQTMQQARADTAAEANADGGGRWEQFNAWFGTMREHIVGFGQQVRDLWGSYFGERAEEQGKPSPMNEEPVNIVSTAGAQIEPMQPRYTGPELE